MNYLKPKTWRAGEALSPAKLNTYIGDQNDFLRYRNVEIKSGLTWNNATSLAANNDNTLKAHFIVQEDEDILLTYMLRFQHTVTGVVYADFYIDDTYYLSSGTATPLTNGACVGSANAAAIPTELLYRKLITGLEAGAHTVSVHGARASGTVTPLVQVLKIRGM